MLFADGSVEDVFCQTFTANQAGIGEILFVELCEGGSSRMVTEENRREFVELYVDYILNKSVHRQARLATSSHRIINVTAIYIWNVVQESIWLTHHSIQRAHILTSLKTKYHKS